MADCGVPQNRGTHNSIRVSGAMMAFPAGKRRNLLCERFEMLKSLKFLL